MAATKRKPKRKPARKRAKRKSTATGRYATGHCR